MIETSIRVKADLDKGIRKTFLDTLFVTGDSKAHRFEIEIVRGDIPATLSGTVSAFFIRYCDNVTIPVDGTLSGNVVSVTLPDSCYNRNTQFALIVKLATSSEVGTVFYGESAMHIGETDAFIDEGNVIPSLNDLLAQIDDMENAMEEANTATDNALAATEKANTAAVSANAAAYAIENVSASAEEADEAAVTVSKVSGAWHFDFKLPKGEKGDQGDSGEMTGTVENAAKLDGKTLAEIMLEIYPVGSIYVSTVATNPRDMFGGEWEQIMGRFLLGASDTYAAGSTGGEATHTLTINEMPAHTHKFGYITGAVAAGDRYARIDSDRTNASGSFNESTGGGAAHNNMPPYVSVYMWKRIS